MNPEFSRLERAILLAKGLSEEQLAQLTEIGVGSRADFSLIGNVVTLLELMPDLDPAVAVRVLEWAVPTSVAAADTNANPAVHVAPPPTIVVESADVVHCANCHAKQPKDYTPGDLCINCGRQAEPIEQCFWCGSSGPGKRCRNCGAQFVPTSLLPLAMLLRRDGLSKDDIPRRIAEASDEEKEQLWGRVRRARM
ncbi:hypothetical protein [Hymenobacter norwichensis]|uniref:hypothetical protein n=1 Tax=Hymenobacter norwichensis TaxID=223903 RepID=UPI0003B4DB61|nr:hypothetical protein [Hymenobacter norwichensis]